MRMIYDERDQLWDSYEKAFRAYVAAVSEFTHELRAEQSTVRGHLVLVRLHREAIERHCEVHGCDPDNMETIRVKSPT